MYKNIYVIGVFDLFHRGHLELLKRAKALGQQLLVGVNSDAKVSLYKRKPICSEHDRLEVVQACRYVNQAFLVEEYDQKKYIEKYKIDAIVHGDDWQRASYLKQIGVTEEYLQEQNTKLLFLPYTHGVSTSQLMQQIAAHTTTLVADKELFY